MRTALFRRLAFLAGVIVLSQSPLATPRSAFAQSARPALAAGEYVMEGGWGDLRLSAGKDGALKFAIETVGANAHTCALEGELRNGRAALAGVEENAPCVVVMKPTAAGIEVEGKPFEACQYYCGMRASFAGLYLAPPPACRAQAMAETRKTFKRLYDAKRFVEARAALEPLLGQCARLLHWIDAGRIRNDLAVTLHKLGDLAGCRALLEPLAADAGLSDAALRENYPPFDADAYLPIVRATRTNLKLCREK